MGSIRKRGAGYEARYRDPAGRSRSRSFKTKVRAKRFLAAVEADMARGAWIDPAKGRVRFSKWASEVMAGKLSQRRSGKDRDLSHLKNHVLPVFGAAPLAQIRRGHVRDWVKFLSEQKGLAPRTVRDCYNVLSYIMREAVEERLIAESPCRRIGLPSVPRDEMRFLDHGQVAVLAAATDPRYRPLIFTGAYLGLRWEEAAGLRRDRVDVLRRRVHVVCVIERIGNGYRYVEDTKTLGSRRLLDVPRPLVEILARHLGTHDEEFVFPSPTGGFLRYHNFMARFWRPAVARSGLIPLTFHELRHTCVALLIDQGADILYVSRFLGHRDIRTTANVYGHLFPQRGHEIAEAMGGALREALESSGRDRAVGNRWDSSSISTLPNSSSGSQNDG